jgi:two-component system, LytTR family, response regulator
MPSPPREPLRVLIVDDEAPARERLVDLLRKDADVTAIAEARNGLVAVEMIADERPDLVFLDVQMPELDGLGVIDAVGATEMPLTIFVTAYDRHAIRAFEANALDYLLKPYSDERQEAAMARAKLRLHERGVYEIGQRMLRMVSRTPKVQASGPLARLVVKSGGTTRFLRVTEIDYIEGAGVYVNLHVGDKALLHRAALQDLVERLDPMRFVRVHRSAVVNIESIVQLDARSHGEFDAVLKHGGRVRVSRTYRAELERRLGQSL